MKQLALLCCALGLFSGCSGDDTDTPIDAGPRTSDATPGSGDATTPGSGDASTPGSDGGGIGIPVPAEPCAPCAFAVAEPLLSTDDLECYPAPSSAGTCSEPASCMPMNCDRCAGGICVPSSVGGDCSPPAAHGDAWRVRIRYHIRNREGGAPELEYIFEHDSAGSRTLYGATDGTHGVVPERIDVLRGDGCGPAAQEASADIRLVEEHPWNIGTTLAPELPFITDLETYYRTMHRRNHPNTVFWEAELEDFSTAHLPTEFQNPQAISMGLLSFNGIDLPYQAEPGNDDSVLFHRTAFWFSQGFRVPGSAAILDVEVIGFHLAEEPLVSFD